MRLIYIIALFAISLDARSQEKRSELLTLPGVFTLEDVFLVKATALQQAIDLLDFEERLDDTTRYDLILTPLEATVFGDRWKSAFPLFNLTVLAKEFSIEEELNALIVRDHRNTDRPHPPGQMPDGFFLTIVSFDRGFVQVNVRFPAIFKRRDLTYILRYDNLEFSWSAPRPKHLRNRQRTRHRLRHPAQSRIRRTAQTAKENAAKFFRQEWNRLLGEVHVVVAAPFGRPDSARNPKRPKDAATSGAPRRPMDAATTTRSARSSSALWAP